MTFSSTLQAFMPPNYVHQYHASPEGLAGVVSCMMTIIFPPYLCEWLTCVREALIRSPSKIIPMCERGIRRSEVGYR